MGSAEIKTLSHIFREYHDLSYLWNQYGHPGYSFAAADLVCNKFEGLRGVFYESENNSPIWVRPQDGTLAKGIFAPGYLQVVGHTPVEKMKVMYET